MATSEQQGPGWVLTMAQTVVLVRQLGRWNPVALVRERVQDGPKPLWIWCRQGPWMLAVKLHG